MVAVMNVNNICSCAADCTRPAIVLRSATESNEQGQLCLPGSELLGQLTTALIWCQMHTRTQI
eukprot:3678517-Prymnesium_polylepis.1